MQMAFSHAHTAFDATRHKQGVLYAADAGQHAVSISHRGTYLQVKCSRLIHGQLLLNQTRSTFPPPCLISKHSKSVGARDTIVQMIDSALVNASPSLQLCLLCKRQLLLKGIAMTMAAAQLMSATICGQQATSCKLSHLQALCIPIFCPDHLQA